jgi:broad specificity phosphatase PhoE
MPLLYLVRHGETDWNREQRWQGHFDRPLSPAGRAQAEAAARRLARDGIAHVHSSDLKRAWQTAEIVAAECGVAATADPALREVDVGSWAGLTHDEARERFPDGYARRRAGGKGWDGGESYEEMGERVVAFATALCESARGSERLALVCHSGVVRMLVAHALGLAAADRRRIGGNGHGAVSVLRVRKGEWSLRVYNDTAHLVGLVAAPEPAASRGA